MQVLNHPAEFKGKRKPIVMAAGFFDGVHNGHRRVLLDALNRARVLDAAAWVLTFDAHPLTVLNPRAAPPLLTATPHKLNLLKRLGFEGCLLLPFSRAVADMAPEQFVEHLRGAIPVLKHICAGRNWRFGRDGAGSPRWLAQRVDDLGWTVSVAPPAVWEGRRISSSWIREAVAHGRLDEAQALLGRPFSVWGTVVPGRGVGKTLGAPTANLVPTQAVTPPFGVYAAHVRLNPRCVRATMVEAVVFLGSPRQATAAPVLEAHLLDTNRDLYGCEIEVIFQKKMRPVRRFASQADLARQIGRDIKGARRFLNLPAREHP